MFSMSFLRGYKFLACNSTNMSYLTVLRHTLPHIGLYFITGIVFASVSPVAHADYREFKSIPVNDSLAGALQQTADASIKEFPQLTGNLALSVINLTAPKTPARADYNGDSSFYPASVIKLFFMVEIFRQRKQSPEITRALQEMIRVSDNDATAYLVDVISNTTSGPEFEGKALDEFIDRRRAINRAFASLGYDISAMAKPWSFGPFGREMQLRGPNRENRNRASANSVASLLYWIVQRRAISTEASEAMMKLLERPLEPTRPDENQVKDFIGEALPKGSKLWSKEGDTSEVRHDTGYIELPDGKKFVAVVFTRIGDEKRVLPTVGRHLFEKLSH